MRDQQLEQPPCETLPLEVVDKYFHSAGQGDPFSNLTARVMCGRCAVQLECLTEAIAQGDSSGVRGGEAPWTIREMHRKVEATSIAPETMARRALMVQSNPLRIMRQSRVLHDGQFPDARTAQ